MPISKLIFRRKTNFNSFMDIQKIIAESSISNSAELEIGVARPVFFSVNRQSRSGTASPVSKPVAKRSSPVVCQKLRRFP